MATSDTSSEEKAQNDRYEVFVSYASANKPLADAACAAIESLGARCWIAPRDITPSQDWSAAIIDAISECRIFLLILSAASNLSEQVKREVQNAVSEAKYILPMRIENVELSKHMKYFIGTPHWLDATAAPIEPHLQRLAETVSDLLASMGEGSGAKIAVPPRARPTATAPVEPITIEAAPSLAPVKCDQANNLPQQASSFIGRKTEVAKVESLLEKSRLLTLTGMGGTGKTRLALQVAASKLTEEGDGIWLVELAPLADPALVPQAVAQTLGVREEAGKPVGRTLCEALKDKRLLLLLDNCEHVLNSCATLVAELLRSCPQVRVLASSREAFGVPGEQAFRVPSLSLPNSSTPLTAEAVLGYEAVRLFVERACQVQPAFTVTDDNAAAVVDVCRRLDGIPLALELAAARIRSLSVEEINNRLDSRFRLLTGGARTALPRQQTLRAMIDWSYNLLQETEKVVLARLSVFAGDWDMAAAEVVCADDDVEDWEVLDLITALADKSLLVVEPRADQTRYHLLETVRQYAADCLVTAGCVGSVRSRHRDYFLRLAEEADAGTRGADQAVWLDRLQADLDNLRTALDWCAEDEAGAESGLRLGKALYRFWRMRGYLTEGRERLAAAVSHAGAREHPLERASALRVASSLEQVQGNLPAARALAEEALAVFETSENAQGGAGVLLTLGNVALMQDDLTAARAYYERGLPLFRKLGEQDGIAKSLGNLGLIMLVQGDLIGATAVCEESLSFFREKGDIENAARTLGSLGEIAYTQGLDDKARMRMEEAIALFHEIGARNGALVGSLCLLGAVMLRQGERAEARARMAEGLKLALEIGESWSGTNALEAWASLCLAEAQAAQATLLLGAATQTRNTLGAANNAEMHAKLEDHCAELKTALGEEEFARLWAEGQTITWQKAVECALTGE